jgi:hypothetical protein
MFFISYILKYDFTFLTDLVFHNIHFYDAYCLISICVQVISLCTL